MRGVIGVALTIAAWVVIFGPLSHEMQLRFNPPAVALNPFLHFGKSPFMDSVIVWIALGASVGVTALIWVTIGGIAEGMERRRRQAEQRRLQAEHQASEKQRIAREQAARRASLDSSLRSLAEASGKAALRLPSHLSSAMAALDQAEREFADGAFAPFWDAVESSVRQLAWYRVDVDLIARNTASYQQGTKEYVGSPPPYTLNTRALPDARPVSDRLSRVVRAAQRSFEFASIYEQRRTNQILVAGFTNLADALNNMAEQLESGMRDFTERIGIAIDDIRLTQGAEADVLLGDIRAIHTQLKEDSKARARSEEAGLAMLDNIQRRRRP